LADRPVLITEARINADDEYDRRRKRYLIMMIIRALCIIGAASTFHLSGWLAGAFVLAALVLPWTAVVMANDGPPKEGVRFRRFIGGTGSAPRQIQSAMPAIDSTDPARTDPTVIDI
jgi:hypothetical protein